MASILQLVTLRGNLEDLPWQIKRALSDLGLCFSFQIPGEGHVWFWPALLAREISPTFYQTFLAGLEKRGGATREALAERRAGLFHVRPVGQGGQASLRPPAPAHSSGRLGLVSSSATPSPYYSGHGNSISKLPFSITSALPVCPSPLIKVWALKTRAMCSHGI